MWVGITREWGRARVHCHEHSKTWVGHESWQLCHNSQLTYHSYMFPPHSSRQSGIPFLVNTPRACRRQPETCSRHCRRHVGTCPRATVNKHHTWATTRPMKRRDTHPGIWRSGPTEHSRLQAGNENLGNNFRHKNGNKRTSLLDTESLCPLKTKFLQKNHTISNENFKNVSQPTVTCWTRPRLYNEKKKKKMKF